MKIPVASRLLSLALSVAHEARKSRQIPGWAKIEKEHLRLFPACEACGRKTSLQVHHELPYHLHPELATAPNNLITLCMAYRRQCHLEIGHGDDFRARNPAVRTDAMELLANPHRRKAIEARAKVARVYQ